MKSLQGSPEEFLQVPGGGHSSASLPGAQTLASGQLCCVTTDESLLSEPQLRPQLNGRHNHETFVRITDVIHQKCSAQDLERGRCSKEEGHGYSPSSEPFYKAEGGVLITHGEMQHKTCVA